MILLYTLTYILLLNSITCITASSERKQKLDSTRAKVLLTNELPPILKKRALVEYDAAIHGPNKAFQMRGSPISSHNDKNGKFDPQVYRQKMAALIASEKASDKHLAYKEKKYRKRSLHEKRNVAAIPDSYAKESDLPFIAPMCTTFGFGTPAQNIEVGFSLATSHTILSMDGTKGTYDHKKSKTVILGKLDEVQELIESTPKTYFSALKDLLEAQDQTLLGAAIVVHILAFLLWIPDTPLVLRNFARRNPGIVGLAPFAQRADGDIWQLGEWLSRTTTVGIVISGIVVKFFSIYVSGYGITPQPGKTIQETADGGTSDSVRYLFGGTCSADYDTSPMDFPVARIDNVSQKLLWIIALRNIYVGLPTSITVAQAGPDQQYAITVPVSASVQFDTDHTFIYLLSSIVTSIYNNIPNSRAPNSRNPYYTYYCRTAPKISFEFLDINKVKQFLSIDQNDWYHGASIDSLGWCVGAIQALPAGATRQLFGLQFMRSWYTAFGVDDSSGEGAIIRLARSVRTN